MVGLNTEEPNPRAKRQGIFTTQAEHPNTAVGEAVDEKFV
jgi:hypothetical protein